MAEDTILSPLGSTIETGEIVDGSVTTPKIADANVLAAKLGVGTLRKITTATMASDGQTLDITGLALAVGETYRLICRIKNIYAVSGVGYALFVNGDTTTTNYYHQYTLINDAAISGARANECRIFTITDSCEAVFVVDVTISEAGYAVMHTSGIRDIGTGLKDYKTTCAKTNATVASITQLTLHGTVASSLGQDSTVDVYKLS